MCKMKHKNDSASECITGSVNENNENIKKYKIIRARINDLWPCIEQTND